MYTKLALIIVKTINSKHENINIFSGFKYKETGFPLLAQSEPESALDSESDSEIGFTLEGFAGDWRVSLGTSSCLAYRL